MQLASIRFALAVLALASTSFHALAQDESDPAQAAMKARFEKFQNTLQAGPVTGQLGSVASIEVPEGVSFTGKSGTTMFQELTENIPSGREVGLIVPEDFSWFVVFDYEASGHVKDDDKDKLDADDLLSSIKEGTDAANEERKRRGWTTMEVVGWHKPPFYDPNTHNLTWSIRGHGADGDTINWSTRLLGRTGIINVNLVVDPQTVDAAVPVFNELMKGFSYNAGQTYAEFKPGDKIAEYGLAALVAGGSGVVLAKTGLLMKFWKFILGGIVAIGAFFKKIFGFGKKTDDAGTTA
jgi:uncharacterized membrane-anchored protein